MSDTLAPEQKLDLEKAEAFGHHFGGMLNGGFAILSASIGHKTGLFDTMSTLPPSTTHEIAAAAGLQERYVREWLGAMTTSGIVEYDGVSDTYSLPPEHAAILTRAAGPGNFAAYAQFLGVMAEVEDKVIQCFRHGGGVGYEHYTDFHRTMAELSAMTHDALLVDVVLPMAPGVTEALESGITGADVGCGQGHAVNILARRFPKSTFVGFDINDGALDVGRKEAADLGLTNASFDQCDAPTLDRPETFEFMTTFDAVHDQADPRGMVAAIFRALKPGGTWLCSDISASSHVGENRDHPLGPMLYTVSCMHCMTVSLAGDGEGLGAMWGVQQAREIFTAAGFTDIAVHQIEGDPANNFYICRKP